MHVFIFHNYIHITCKILQLSSKYLFFPVSQHNFSSRLIYCPFFCTTFLLQFKSKQSPPPHLPPPPLLLSNLGTCWVTAMTLHCAHSHVSAGSSFMQSFRSPGVCFHDGPPFYCVCWPGEADSESAALGYFITPCVGTLVTLFCYLLLPRLVSHCIVGCFTLHPLAQSHRVCLWKPGLFQQSRF